MLERGARLLAGDGGGGLHLFDMIPTPVRRICGLDLCGGELRGLTLRPGSSPPEVFVCSMSEGSVYGVVVEGLKGDAQLRRTLSLTVDNSPRALDCFGRMLAVGYHSGVVQLYDLASVKAPVFSRRVHAGAVMQMTYVCDLEALVTAGKDRVVKFFKVNYQEGLPRCKDPSAESVERQSDDEDMLGWNS